MTIKDIRLSTGCTQQQFSDIYEIPLSTLRHWEQGVAVCPGYFIKALWFTVNFDGVLSDFMADHPNDVELLKELLAAFDNKK